MDQVIAKRAANALFADAKLSRDAVDQIEKIIEGLGEVASLPTKGASSGLKVVEGVLARFSEKFGGLWVGGTATLRTNKLSFEPNAMNRVLHEDGHALVLDLPLVAISEVLVKSGFVTDIVQIHAQDAMFSIRCFKAKDFARQIGSLLPRAGARL